MAYFDGFNFTDFWDDDEYAIEEYVEDASPTDELIASLEAELGGYKLPGSYIALARMHNGGTPAKACFPMSEPTGWAEQLGRHRHCAGPGIR